MRRLFFALATGVLLLLLAGVGTATAGEPVGRDASSPGSDPAAGILSWAAQQQPSSTDQSNTASSNGTAGNLNGSSQSATQGQASGSGIQATGQSATNAQDALALAGTVQKGASNENTPVRVLSGGDDGSVSQSNTASSNATAGNANGTQQTAGQNQGGGSCCGTGGTQTVGQSAGNEQGATAVSATVQEKPSNTNTPVRVLSPGSDGSISQSNEATSDATAANVNGTAQTAGQTQTPGASPCGCGSTPTRVITPDPCSCSGGGTQAIGQSADNAQQAKAASLTDQEGASNDNISVRVLSPGSNGSVSQSNAASSNAAAGNLNGTAQSATQNQAGGGGSQAIGQSADSEQGAAALAGTVQKNPSNSNISVRVLSPGDDGDVSQSNTASSDATAANVNGTKQAAGQNQAGSSDSCGCGGAGTQAIGQSATNHQGALAGSLTEQTGASNENISVRVLSPGNGGSVSQTNAASSKATAGNLNGTEQSAGQTQGGRTCGCGGSGTQVIGQSAQNGQAAGALSATIQESPSNSNVPVRVESPGNDGSVSQSNTASSDATAANLNGTEQKADQAQAGGSGIQAIGQDAKSGQLAVSAALTAQLGASNENAPVRVLSPGNGGSVTQSNTASSNANAGNANGTSQNAAQSQGAGKSGCCGSGIQAIGQSSQNWQSAGALGITLQLGSRQPCKCQSGSQIGNSNAPTRVLSPGDDGSVRQSNDASSDAKSANWNATRQAASQIQTRPDCGCRPAGIQAIGQEGLSGQNAGAVAATFQLGALNAWAPDRKSSPGTWGNLSQTGRSASDDAAGSRTATDQSRTQAKR